jgi:hypothetical protein
LSLQTSPLSVHFLLFVKTFKRGPSDKPKMPKRSRPVTTGKKFLATAVERRQTQHWPAI